MDRDFCLKFGKDIQHSFQCDCARNLEEWFAEELLDSEVFMETTIHTLFQNNSSQEESKYNVDLEISHHPFLHPVHVPSP